MKFESVRRNSQLDVGDDPEGYKKARKETGWDDLGSNSNFNNEVDQKEVEEIRAAISGADARTDDAVIAQMEASKAESAESYEKIESRNERMGESAMSIADRISSTEDRYADLLNELRG